MQLPTKLETERLVLRPCCERDYTAYAAFMRDKRAIQYLAFSPEQLTEEGSRELFDYVLSSYKSEQPMFVLAICTKEDDQYIGSCGLSPLREGEAECYYTLLRQHWGQGYATEATKELLRYAFTELKLQRIVAIASQNNPASWRVAEKVGMIYESAVEANPDEYRDKGKLFAIHSSMTDTPTLESAMRTLQPLPRK